MREAVTLSSVAPALEQVAALFPDTRLQHCRLEVVQVAGGNVTVGGTVLDHGTLERVRQELVALLPGAEVDVSAVEVLRDRSRFAAVGTNITGLYAQPSFLAEQLSQLLNGWPLEILKEEGRWRFVRQADGYLGWVFALYLAGATSCAFTHLVSEPVALVLLEPVAGAGISTQVLGGAAVTVDATDGDWCHLALAGEHSGWVRRENLRSFDALPETPEARRSQMMADAARFAGVQYLWGGCSAWGIDCSGFSQLIHRLSGMTLPRDADMQYAAGRPVEFPYRPGDLLFYGDPDKRGTIDHVSISTGGWNIIHSSRRINGVYYDNVQAVQGLRENFVGARTFVG